MNKPSRHTRPADLRRKRKFTRLFFGLSLLLIILGVMSSQCAVRQKAGESAVFVPSPVSPVIPPKPDLPTHPIPPAPPISSDSSVMPEDPESPGDYDPSQGMVVSTRGVEIPAVADPEFLVVCPEGRYTLWYDTLYRQAAWAAHVLTRSDVEGSRAERKNSFVICQTVRSKGWPYAKSSDYTHTGYDRGHLVPSADRACSQEENDATFRLSNISPQHPRLNRVLWNHLETEVRKMAERLDTLWIVTGGELKPGLRRLGTSRIGIPEHFFKVLLARKEGDFMTIAFVVPNHAGLKNSFWEYAVPVEQAERLLGIDFFATLPEALQRRIEAQCRPENWK